MASQSKRPNRVKIVGIDERLLLEVFNWWRNPPGWLSLPVTDELPEDCEVLRVWTNYERRCIDLLVYSSHFPICQDADVPERVSDNVREVRAVPFGSGVNLPVDYCEVG